MHDKIRLATRVVGYPMPVAILGTEIDGKPSFMALAWLARVNHKPPMMGIAVGRSHASYQAIVDTNCSGLSFPSQDQRVATDYVGMTS